MNDAAFARSPLQSVTLLLGSPFSGSSLLGQSLNDIAGIAYAGEVDRMHRFGFPLHQAGNHYRSRCSICTSHADYDCPVYPLPHEPLAAPGAFSIDDYLSVLQRFDAPFVVDGSKNVDWLWYLQGKGVLEVLPTRVILVARSVWAFVASQKRAGAADPYQAAEGWRNIYRHALRSIAALAVPNLLVRHEDFVTDMDRALSRAAWFVSDRPHNLHEPKPLHCIGGNPSAFSIRGEFDREGHLRVIPAHERLVSEEKFAFFGGGDAPRQRPLERWAREIGRDEAYAILSLPGVMETMLDLGYAPLRILDEYHALRAA